MKKRGEVFEFGAIGVVKTPFRDKFGIPRQPGLAANAKGLIKIDDDPDLKTALRSLEEFSHIWIVFVFHEHGGRNWKPSIRPPRLGGNRKVGVLSSRSPHRPNPIGMSAVKIERVDLEAAGGAEIHVAGVDLLDGTPVLDLKPYIPYADSIADANAGWASEPISRVKITLSAEAEKSLLENARGEELRPMILEVLELDPRPAFQKTKIAVDDPKSEGSAFGFDLLGCEIKYEIRAGGFFVTSLEIGPEEKI